MLRSRMWSYVASRPINSQTHIFRDVRSIMNPSSMGPMKVKMNKAKNELKILDSTEKHWFCGGNRSVAMAAQLLQQGKVIAVPTDTIYGLAGLASDIHAVQRLYEIKQRDENKPLAICLSNIKDIGDWAIMDGLPNNLLESLLPGPYTICLRRQSTLNPALNPGLESVGIRVPDNKFIRSVAKLVGPLALTSANVSSKPSSLHPEEFQELWPELDGIFHSMQKKKEHRIGSTIVDLSQPGYYKVIRYGIAANIIVGRMNNCGLKKITDE